MREAVCFPVFEHLHICHYLVGGSRMRVSLDIQVNGPTDCAFGLQARRVIDIIHQQKKLK